MIVAFTGFKRSGKDTCADFLVKNYGFVQYSFADTMRSFIKDTFLWDDDWLENHKEEIDPRWGITYREVMTILGTEWMQLDLCERYPLFKETTGRNVWAKRFTYKLQQDPTINYTISDLRFPHEEKVIRDLGGVIIRVMRKSTKVSAHSSEAHIDEISFDDIIDNDGSIEDLHCALKRSLSTLKII